jgi:hypothetical protein
LIGEVPCWAYDMHVREGKQAIARLLKTDCEIARWARDQIPAKSQMGFFGHVLFRVESGLVVDYVIARIKMVIDGGGGESI